MSTSLVDLEFDARATNVVVTAHHLTVDFDDGRTISVPLSWFPRLAHGTPQERANVVIGDFGLHWEDLNEDLSYKGLILGHKSGESRKSFERWLGYRARGEKEPIPYYPLPPDIERELQAMGIDTRPAK